MLDTQAMFAETARLIKQVALAPGTVEQGMQPWFDYCERVAPECRSLWQDLRQLDFNQDEAALTAWLQELLRTEPPPAEITGLWFGLHNSETDEGEPSCQFYVGGSPDFDPQSASNEWACHLTWRPAAAYPRSAVLAELYRTVEPLEENDVNYLGEAFLCHGYLAWLVAHWCGSLRNELLGAAKCRAVAMGHDSGDFYRIAVLSTE